MDFWETPLSGSFVITPNARGDERGWFARVFCASTFRAQGLVDSFMQMNHSRSEIPGTVRGLHFQLPPHGEVKLARCTRGEVFDVFVDVRQHSPTFLKSFGILLSEVNRKMVYVPPGFAHGFQALTPGCEFTYSVSAEYAPEHERQIHSMDPRLEIDWPVKNISLSEKDQNIPFLEDDFKGVLV